MLFSTNSLWLLFSWMASMLEGPLVVAEQIDLVLVHFPQRKRFSTPIQYATPNDNERTKHLCNHIIQEHVMIAE